MTDTYAAADHDQYWERRREAAEGPDHELAPVYSAPAKRLKVDHFGIPIGELIRVCCHVDCHRVIDAHSQPTGERLSDEEYHGKCVSHGYCQPHHDQVLREWNAKRANRAA